MTFTYSEDLSVDRDYVRFMTGDTTSGENFLSDEIIASLITTEGTKQKAVIAALRYIIRQLSKPNFRADWLQIDYASARQGYEKVLRDLLTEFGLSTLEVSSVQTYRGDSDTVTEPDYTGGRPGDEESEDSLYYLSSEYTYRKRRSSELL
jgi:hypothetical protein